MSSKITIESEIDNQSLDRLIADETKKKLIEEFTQQAKKILFSRPEFLGYNNEYYLQDWIKDYIKEIIANEKDTIIEKAAESLADSMRRSKNIREKFGELLDKEMEKSK